MKNSFSCSTARAMSLLITLSGFVIGPTMIFAEEKADTSAVTLDEIEITGRREINKGDHVQLYLSKRNETFGTNALDAISSLNRFKTTINDNTITNKFGDNVFILINGVPSNGSLLQGYKSDQIKYVEYYPTAPGKYISFTQGPVLNVVLRKRHDQLYHVYANTSNNLTYGTGVNSISASVTDSLNRLSINYGIGYNDIHKIKHITDYNYSDLAHTSIRTDEGKYKSLWQWAGANYQLYKGAHLFNANISYSWSDSKSDTPSDIDFTNLSNTLDSYSGHYEKTIDQAIRSLNADFYYHKRIGNTKLFQINVVNTFGNNFTDTGLGQTIESQPDLDYEFVTNQHNKTYEMTANAVFSMAVRRVSLDFAGVYNYTQLNRTDNDNKYKSSGQNGMLYVSLTHYLNQSSGYYISLGAQANHYDITSQKTTDFSPYAIANAMWNGRGKLNGLSMVLQTRYSMERPNIGQITDYISFIDRYYLQIGNPNLKPTHAFNGVLKGSYYFPDGRNSIQIRYRANYFHDEMCPLIFTDDKGIAYNQIGNIDNSFYQNVYMSGTWYPFSFLELNPYIEYYNSRFDTPSNKVRWENWRFGGAITFSQGNWTASISANSPLKRVTGDFRLRESDQYGARVSYKYRGWSFGLKYHYSGMKNTKSANCKDFSLYERSDTKCFTRSLSVDITYSFSHGRARNHDQKFLYNNNRNNGVVIDPGTPKK